MRVTPSSESRSSVRRGTDGVDRGASGRAQLGRLFRLVMILQADRFPNARELAERCEVSRRTIFRDFEQLAEAGFPVWYRSDRQGYQLSRGTIPPPTDLGESETLALLVMARQQAWGNGLGFLSHAWCGAVKLVQALPAEVRERVLSAAEPFRVETPAGGGDPDRKEVQETILSALSQMRQVRVWYRRTDDGAEECTKFSLYRLTLHDRHWFMVGRSSLHRKVVVIGVPWVQKLVLTGDGYTIPPRFNLERFLGQAWGVDRAPVRYRVLLRFSPKVVPELNDKVWHRTQRKVHHADGHVDLHFIVDGVEELLRWVLGFGDQVEVLEPAELKRRVFEVATALARRHRPRRYPDGGGRR